MLRKESTTSHYREAKHELSLLHYNFIIWTLVIIILTNSYIQKTSIGFLLMVGGT